MAGSRTNFLSLLENENVSAFCAFNEDFNVFKGQILNHNLFKNHVNFIQKCIFMQQIHSNKVVVFNNCDQINLSCDGLISTQKNIALCVLSADCLPLLLWHKSGIIAALHSGREGSFANILNQALQTIKQQNSNIDFQDFTLIIAPAISAKNYAIDGEILQYSKTHFKEFLEEKQLNLKALVKFQAQNLGIKNIIDCEICSFDDERFFSYRRDKTPKRFASIIALKG